MMKRAWPWMALAASTGTAWALDTGGSSGPDWHDVALGALSLLGTAIGFYVRGMAGTLREMKTVDKATEVKVAALELIISRDYHTKAELQNMLDRTLAPISGQVNEVKEHVQTLFGRMDDLRIVRVKPHDHDQG